MLFVSRISALCSGSHCCNDCQRLTVTLSNINAETHRQIADRARTESSIPIPTCFVFSERLRFFSCSPQWQNLDCLSWIYSYGYEETYRQLAESARARVQRAFEGSRLVSGHFQYGLHRIGHRGTFTYVTSLRDPVTRVISWWNWSIGRVPDAAPNATFETFLSEDLPFGGFQKSNHMVRVLCNDGTGLRGQPGVWYHEDTPLSSLIEVTKEHYECALRNLKRDFALVFVAERIGEVLALAPSISRLFNMKMVVQLGSDDIYNPTGFKESTGMVKRSGLSEETAARLRGLNVWDTLLYKQACVLHAVSVARLQGMKGRLEAARTVN